MDVLHSFDANVECLKCGRCFVRNVTLEEHKQFSCQPCLTFVCPPCDQKFENGWYLDQHLIRHRRQEFLNKQEATASQLHYCGHCNTSFISPFTLSTHQIYSCPDAPLSPGPSQQSSETESLHEEQTETTDDEEKLKIVETFPEDTYSSSCKKISTVNKSNEDLCAAVNNKSSTINNMNDNSSNENNNNNNSNSDNENHGSSGNNKNNSSNITEKYTKDLNITLVLNNTSYYLRKNKNVTTSSEMDNNEEGKATETRNPLKVILKTKNPSEKMCLEISNDKTEEDLVNALLKDIPSDIDRKKVVETILKMVSTLKEGHRGLRAGNAAFLYEPPSAEIRMVKVLKVTDGVLRAASFEVEEKKLAFSSNVEILQLKSVFCHGQFEFPRKRGQRVRRELLVAFNVLPRVFLGILTSPRVVQSFDEENLIPEWVFCTKSGNKEGKSPKNVDEKPSSEMTSRSKTSVAQNNNNDIEDNNSTKCQGQDTTEVDNLKPLESRENYAENSEVLTTNKKTLTSDGNINLKFKKTPPKKAYCGNGGRKKDKEQKEKRSSIEAIENQPSEESDKCNSKSHEVSEKKKSILEPTDKDNCLKDEKDVEDALSSTLTKLESAKDDIKKGRGNPKLKAYPCRVCGRCFAYQETRDCHEDVICNASVRKERFFSCVRCCHDLESCEEYDLHTVMKCSPKKLRNSKTRVRQGSKPCVCRYCQKQFVQASTLATHLDYCCVMKSEANRRLSDPSTRSGQSRNWKTCSCCR